jgi:hypothetical protein
MSQVNRRFTNPLATRPASAPNSFEEIVRELNLLPEEYANSAKLRAWVLRYKDEKYVPSDLLKAFGFECTDG